MRIRFAAAVLVTLSLTACAGSSEDVAESEDAIVGGQIANAEHPEVVDLQVIAGSKTWNCTGTMVGRRTVLTARHCLEDGAILSGGACSGAAYVDTKGQGANGATRIGFERCMVPDLGKEGRSNDVALVRLESNAIGIVPAVISRGTPSGSTYTVYGYGDFGAARGSHCASPTDAQKRKLTYHGPLSWHFGRFTCPGDSGGPHFVAGTNVIAGVTSMTTAFGVDINAVPYRYVDVLDQQIDAFERD
jgi:secreted trypsin-like serine protease